MKPAGRSLWFAACGLIGLLFLACGEEQRSAATLASPWQEKLDLLNEDPGTLPPDWETGGLKLAPEVRPQAVRLLVGVRAGSVRVLEGPYPVPSGSHAFSRQLTTRRKVSPVAWWFQWFGDTGDLKLYEPDHWTPFDAGAGVRGSSQTGDRDAHFVQDMQTETEIGVNLPFSPRGTVAAVSAEGSLLGMWQFGDTAEEAMTPLTVPGSGS
jgi:hypothetical protein